MHGAGWLYVIAGGAAEQEGVGGRGGAGGGGPEGEREGGDGGGGGAAAAAADDVQRHVPDHVRPAVRQRGGPAVQQAQGGERRAQPPLAELRVQLRRLHPRAPALPQELPQQVPRPQAPQAQALRGPLRPG